ncbi:ProQ/FINO family protein, partial [Escherichia coli]|uniref:ProQ/FINO family protein n=1 Tax=Escherichia coli TaxID=562 RepID=UPI003B431CEE
HEQAPIPVGVDVYDFFFFPGERRHTGPSPVRWVGRFVKGTFPRQPHWTHEFTHNCVEKVKSLFPHLRAESGGFLPLKIGITNDFAAFLTEHPETELTLDEWSCAISCITTRQVYLLRTAVAGIPRYGLDGLPAGQVSECDAQNARRWLAVREKQKLKMKTMQEQTASTEKIER